MHLFRHQFPVPSRPTRSPLRRTPSRPTASRRHARLWSFESLEARRLLAVDLLSSDLDAPSALIAETISEGEAAADLVEFAKRLADANVRLFGAAWDDDTTAQRQLFGDGGDDLLFVEVTDGNRQLNEIADAEAITSFPVWEFPDETRVGEILSLTEISTRAGIEIPLGETPSFSAIGDQSVSIGSPLHIPIDAYDPNGDPLDVTVTVDDPDKIEAMVISGNRSIRLDMDGFGDMVFELFEQRAPVPAGRVITLAESGFYDGIIFHRIDSNFVIQAGDPTGIGNGGSDLGFFDDQFHADLQHNRTGVLSFAKSSDDTNNSQFFILESPARFLDFNHSVFGQLVEGDDVREAISGMNVIDLNSLPPNQRPVIDIPISTIEVFEDRENAVVMLKAKGDAPVTISVTVTVSDGANFVAETFTVNVTADSDSGPGNSPPFLKPIQVPTEFFAYETLNLQLTSIDIEDDPVVYNARLLPGTTVAIDGNINRLTGQVSLRPETRQPGRIILEVEVGGRVDATGNLMEPIDSQRFAIDVVAPRFHRLEKPPDVDGDDGVSALDALLIINAMFENGGEVDLADDQLYELNPDFAYNVNGDARITALDALQVINAVARAESQHTQAADAVFAAGIWLDPRRSWQDDEDESLSSDVGELV